MQSKGGGAALPAPGAPTISDALTPFACCSSSGCDTVTPYVTKKDSFGIMVVWRDGQTVHWCWSYPRITSFSAYGHFWDVDGTSAKINYSDNGYGYYYYYYYYTWAGSTVGGHFSDRQGSVSNCVFHYGCFGTSYPEIQVLGVFLAAAAVALGVAGTAGAGGTMSVSVRFYTDHTRYSVRFHVFDTTGSCVPDQYGGYDNINCYSDDSNDASLDIHIYRRGRHGYGLIYSDELSGLGGHATATIYDFQTHDACYSWTHRYVHNYKVLMRLFDPVTDTIAARAVRYYYYRCH
jgi:hypothetical protein